MNSVCRMCSITYKVSRQNKNKTYCSWECHARHKAEKAEKNFEPRFWSNVQIREGECWLWTGRKNTGGYGVISLRRSGIQIATRVMLRFKGVEIPDGMKVCHSCDNPPCVNPDHLWLGTQADNIKDAKAKGRIRNGSTKTRGEAHGRSKLTGAQVDYIRKTDSGIAELSKRFSVTETTIRSVRSGKIWGWMP